MHITSNKTIPVYTNGAGIHEVIKELQRQAREIAYDRNFYKYVNR